MSDHEEEQILTSGDGWGDDEDHLGLEDDDGLLGEEPAKENDIKDSPPHEEAPIEEPEQPEEPVETPHTPTQEVSEVKMDSEESGSDSDEPIVEKKPQAESPLERREPELEDTATEEADSTGMVSTLEGGHSQHVPLEEARSPPRAEPAVDVYSSVPKKDDSPEITEEDEDELNDFDAFLNKNTLKSKEDTLSNKITNLENPQELADLEQVEEVRSIPHLSSSDDS